MTESPNETLAKWLASGRAVEHSDSGRRRIAERGVMSHQVTAVGDFDAIGNRAIGQRSTRTDCPYGQTRSRPMHCRNTLTDDHLRLIAARTGAHDLHANSGDSWFG